MAQRALEQDMRNRSDSMRDMQLDTTVTLATQHACQSAERESREHSNVRICERAARRCIFFRQLLHANAADYSELSLVETLAVYFFALHNSHTLRAWVVAESKNRQRCADETALPQSHAVHFFAALDTILSSYLAGEITLERMIDDLRSSYQTGILSCSHSAKINSVVLRSANNRHDPQ